MSTFPASPRRARLGRPLLLGLLALGLGACANMSARERNAAVGATVGGVAGSVLTGGSTLGTVGGAVAGGLIGSRAGEGDRERGSRDKRRQRDHDD